MERGRPRLGMHLSIAGGLGRMAERARDFGCEAAQIFSRSPRGGEARTFSSEEIEGMKSTLQAAGVHPLVVHTPYFINLVSSDDSLRDYAVRSLSGELRRAAVLGAPYVVTHTGRPSKEEPAEDAVGLAAASVSRALGDAGDGTSGVVLLLENTSGAGREMGADLTEIAGLRSGIEAAHPGRSAVCLDTCHAHSAGYDLSSPDGVRRFASLAGNLFGPGGVRVVHANDSAGEAGSRLDRHRPIGQGTIGLDGWRALLSEPLFGGCPFLVETPGSDEERAEDLKRLRTLRDEARS